MTPFRRITHCLPQSGRVTSPQQNTRRLYSASRQLINHVRQQHQAQPIQVRHMSSSDTSTDEVILERKGSKGIITINRPKHLNALNLPMIKTLYPQLRKWETDSGMNLVIIKATGDKAFCAGGDVKGMLLLFYSNSNSQSVL